MGNLDPVSPTFDILRQPIQERSGLTPMSGSPYIVTREWFSLYLGFNGHRLNLIRNFDEFVSRLIDFGISPTFAMIGGSFVSDKIDPKDIDGVIGYIGNNDSDFIGLKDFITTPTPKFLDIRLVPEDSGGLNLVKICCYYHELYSRNRMKSRTSCVLFEVANKE